MGAVGLLAVVLWVAGPERTFHTLARLDLWQAAVLVVSCFGVSLCTALAWRTILARYGHVLSVWLLFRLTIVAFTAGWIVPSGFVAGIPLVAWPLRRRGVPFSRGLASFGISRFLEGTAYGAVLPITLASELGSSRTVQAVVLVIVTGFVLVYLDLFLGWRLARRLLRRGARALPRTTRAAIDFCATVADFFRGGIGPVLLATAYSFAAIGVALVRAFLANAFLELHLTDAQIVVMFAITMLLMVVPFLPGAVGAFEAGIAGAFEAVGRSKADGLAYAVTIHAAEFVVVVAGLVMLAHLGIGLFGRVPQARDRAMPEHA